MDDRTMTPARALRNGGHGRAHDHDLTNRSHHDTPPEGSWEAFRGVGDPAQRFNIYRLCPCPECDGTGKDRVRDANPHLADREGITYSFTPARCPDCRGEGRQLQLVATCGTPEAVGVALVTLGREGEWSDCPLGILDSEGEKGQKWLVSPWERSPRNVSDAGRLLQRQRAVTEQAASDSSPL